MLCPNAKYGCKEKISDTENRNHEEECIYKPCCCPLLGCDFIASSEDLSDHFDYKHRDLLIEFSYGHSFVVFLKSNDENTVLREKNNGKLFILNNSTSILGNTVNIYCIGPKSSELEYNYDILVDSKIYKLKLQSSAKIVQQFTSTTLSPEFPVIPFDSSGALKLEICINFPTVHHIYFSIFELILEIFV
jgi:E3 ubiquitin-protein ligase SIAH1